MFIITDKESLVMGVTEKVVHASNGNVGINETYFFDKSIVGGVLEVSEIPADYADYKYKYIDGKFQVYEGWKEPSEYLTLDQLQKKLESQNKAIAELTMIVSMSSNPTA